MLDSEILGKQLQKIQEHKSRYYISSDDIVMLNWNGEWVPYDYVAVRDVRFRL